MTALHLFGIAAIIFAFLFGLSLLDSGINIHIHKHYNKSENNDEKI